MKKQISPLRNDVISASEISQYTYCSISWHLQKCGYKSISPLIEVGKKIHINLGKTIDDIQDEIDISRRFMVIGCLLLIFAIIVVIYGVVL
ncbi:MAG: hypothetical protein JSW60_03540 [Thermoplasmatales archaeon]|nr:MAG: hypothetical protein JSW60_03540 [Thermoplasmatales archaeon]